MAGSRAGRKRGRQEVKEEEQGPLLADLEEAKIISGVNAAAIFVPISQVPDRERREEQSSLLFNK